MADTLTISIKFKLTKLQENEGILMSLCHMYKDCLKNGMKALIAQNEINLAVGQTRKCEECGGCGYDVNNFECNKCKTLGVIDIKKPPNLTVSRQAMPDNAFSNMKDSASQEVNSTWRSWSALWDKQLKRSFPEFKGLGSRFRLRERSLTIDHERKVLKIAIPGQWMEFGYLGSKDMYEALENCKHGAFDVIKSRKGDWFIRIFCKITPKNRQNSKFGPIISVHTGMNWCVCALAAWPNGSFRFLFVPYFPLWGAKKRKKNLRRSLQSKGKLHKVKVMGERESRISTWYYHTVTKKLAEWIATQRPERVILGEHLGLKSAKAKKSGLKHIKKQNYWLSNYAYRSILDKLKYKLILGGVEFETADTFKLKTTKTCSKCGGDTLSLERRAGRVCTECGKTLSNEWNALRNLLPKKYRKIYRNKKPAERLLLIWKRCGVIEMQVKRILTSLHQKKRKVA